MLLKKVTIHKYKSFLTEQSFQVEDQITRIVGKNESGKTALLEALAKTNYFEDNKAFMFSKELDYPRGELTKVRNENPEAITCEYELSDEDIQSIADDFKAGIVEKQEFSVTSYYDNTQTTTGISANFKIFKEWLIEKFGIGDKGKELIISAEDYANLLSVADENNELPGMSEIKEKLEKFKANSDDSDWFEDYIYNTYVDPAIPKLWYFSDYYSLPCRISLTDFAAGHPTGS